MNKTSLTTSGAVPQDGGEEMNPLVGRMSDMVASAVPGSKRETIKLEPNHPFKAVGIAITRGCKTLSNRLQNIVTRADCGGFVFLRQQVRDFIDQNAPELEPIYESYTRPLYALRDEIEACDIDDLVEGAIEKLKSAIQITPYSLRDLAYTSPFDNEWAAIETAIIQVGQLVQGGGAAQKVQDLFEKYYRKYLAGILEYICREKESNTPTYGKEKPEDALQNFQSKIRSRVSGAVVLEFQEFIETHQLAQLISRSKRDYVGLMGDLDFFKSDTLQQLPQIKQKSPGDKNKIAWAHSIIIAHGSNIMDNLRRIIEELIPKRDVLDNWDGQFLSEMEEALMMLHLKTIQSSFEIERDPLYDYLCSSDRSVESRMNSMEFDIRDTCKGNTKRVPIWNKWYQDLRGQRSSGVSKNGPNNFRRIPGGAFGKRK